MGNDTEPEMPQCAALTTSRLLTAACADFFGQGSNIQEKLIAQAYHEGVTAGLMQATAMLRSQRIGTRDEISNLHEAKPTGQPSN